MKNESVIAIALAWGLATVGCSKSKDEPAKPAETPAEAAPAAPEPTPEPTPAPDPAALGGAGLAPTGKDLDRLCGFYASAKKDVAEMLDEKLGSDPVADCKNAMEPRAEKDRQAIADCANVCGDTDGVVDCFEKFGTDEFPACEPQGDGEQDEGPNF
jgi:hypothetical protein